MKQRNRARSSTLFLVELIIAILFFTVCSAVCVQFFVKSHTLSRQAVELNCAVNECSTAAELIQSGRTEGEILNALKSIYPEALKGDSSEEHGICIYFDSDFKQCAPSAEDLSYIMDIDMVLKGSRAYCTIEASSAESGRSSRSGSAGRPIYSIELRHNLQEVSQ